MSNRYYGEGRWRSRAAKGMYRSQGMCRSGSVVGIIAGAEKICALKVELSETRQGGSQVVGGRCCSKNVDEGGGEKIQWNGLKCTRREARRAVWCRQPIRDGQGSGCWPALEGTRS